jgi:(p)ppGpp synthase/HD superfamily hydrolase
MKIAEELARRWMPGHREGPGNRFAWEHPEDLVRVLTIEMPIEVDVAEAERRIALAWLHDIIEDGRKEDGSGVDEADLFREGVDPEVIADVLSMTRRTYQEGGALVLESKEQYLGRLKEAKVRAKVVKCVDRTCNLREGRETFKDRRWIRYVGETYYFIYPLTESLPKGAERSWLQAALIQAVQARQLRTTAMYPDPLI